MRLVLFLLFTVTLQAQASSIIPAAISEINEFTPEWCAPNQIIAQDIKIVCVGSAKFDGVGSTRAIVVQRADQTRELFVEKDFSSIDMMNLQFEIIGPVATNKARERFAPKYNGEVQLDVDALGETEVVSGSLRLAEKFYATRPQ